MRFFPWVGGVILVAVVSAATAASLRTSDPSAPTFTASKSSVALVFEGSRSGANLRPSPTPTPIPSSAPARPASAAAPVRTVAPSIVIGSTQQALINRDRAAAGLGPLTWSSCLRSVAASNAARLSRQGWVPPYHTNGPSLDLGCHLGNRAGENVGYWSGGINDSQLNTMFMNSADHRANIMGPYHYVATAWAVASNGSAYIAVEFG
jgi:uncharacterized protein YkwD